MPEETDRLYTLPLEEFTPARDALARELRDHGDKEAAAAVKALRKPNRTAWALNQLARRHADELEELFAVTQLVRETQRRVMSGAKADLRAASDERNAVVARLVKLTAAILEEAGNKASQQTTGAIRDSLFAVASDEEGAELLRAGRLTRELEPGSVVDVGGLQLVPSAPDDAGPPAGLRPDLTSLRVAVANAERRKADADHAAELARGEAERLQQAAEFARRAAEARSAEAAEAARALEEAGAALRSAEDA